MTERTLGEMLEETLFSDTPFKSGKQEEVDWESRTYSYEEEGDLFLPPSLFERVSEFGSATVMGRGKDLDIYYGHQTLVALLNTCLCMVGSIQVQSNITVLYILTYRLQHLDV